MKIKFFRKKNFCFSLRRKKCFSCIKVDAKHAILLSKLFIFFLSFLFPNKHINILPPYTQLKFSASIHHTTFIHSFFLSSLLLNASSLAVVLTVSSSSSRRKIFKICKTDTQQSGDDEIKGWSSIAFVKWKISLEKSIIFLHHKTIHHLWKRKKFITPWWAREKDQKKFVYKKKSPIKCWKDLILWIKW